MPFTSKELAQAYRKRKDVKDKKNAKARTKYASDEAYRKSRIKQATDHRKTPLGTIQSRLRINNYYARKFGYADCRANAQEVLDIFCGHCTICLSSLTLLEAVIDHDHISGKFRGWLCNGCNKGLGHFRDSKIILLNAAQYLGESNG